MSVAGPYLYDIGQLSDKLTREFAALPYEEFAEDTQKIESAVMRLAIMKEGWTWLPTAIQQELVEIDWHTVTGKWDWKTRRHVGIDSKQLWETIVWRLPEMSRKVEELLKRRK
jgi:uncharacterized protein with HEPN domain